LCRLLGGAGYEVVPYATGEEFLESAGPGLSGCVLLDLRLPGASGLELQDLLVKQGCTAPVIFLTAHGDVAASVRAMKMGAVDFLQKPVLADELLACVSSAVERDALERLRLQAARQRLEEHSELRARTEGLSARQRAVWLRVAQGMLNKEVAFELGIVERTVKLHRAKLMRKLHAGSTADLVRIAERLGLTRDPG